MDLIAALKEIFGPAGIVTDADVLKTYLTDWTGRFTGEAACLVRPSDSWQVQKLIKLARRTNTPVVIQGGNTGLVGGSVPVRGGIILQMGSFKHIEIDEVSRTARAGAGVTLSELNDKASVFGLHFGVDLASRDSATIGGMVATNAGGIHFIRHGGVRQQLLGAEIVFGSGEIISRMDGLYKDNSGYDLISLICGSEGTLGIVLRVIVKLVPIPSKRIVGLVSVEGIDSAIGLMNYLKSSFDSIDALEIMSRSGLECVGAMRNKEWPMGEFPPYAVLIELTGENITIEDLASSLSLHTEIRDAVISDDSRIHDLWSWREDITVAISQIGVPRKYDISLPLGKITEFVDRLKELLASDHSGSGEILFGHLGDGNIHVNLLGVDPTDDEIDHAVLALCSSLGGSISAEHGIGRVKAADLSLTRSPQDIAVMIALKAVLDPSGILNPGVIFTEM